VHLKQKRKDRKGLKTEISSFQKFLDIQNTQRSLIKTKSPEKIPGPVKFA